MTAVHIEQHEFNLEEQESLLDGLLRNGVNINHGCKSGVCQSCIVTVKDGEIPLGCQSGLNENQKSLNYVLSCQCRPTSTLHINKVDAEQLTQAVTVLEKEHLNDTVLRLRLSLIEENFQAGQYITLYKDEHIGRSYSIASSPEDGYIECHIKIHPNGQFSSWAAESLKEGDVINAQGPMGLCFYQAPQEQPLLLAAISTGLAPLLGILNKALSSQHVGKIDLVLGAKHSRDLYLVNDLQNIATKHPNVTVHFLSQEGESDFSQINDIYKYCMTRLGSLNEHKVYLCGAESFVAKMRKTCFLAGTAMSNIIADSFVAFKKS